VEAGRAQDSPWQGIATEDCPAADRSVHITASESQELASACQGLPHVETCRKAAGKKSKLFTNSAQLLQCVAFLQSEARGNVAERAAFTFVGRMYDVEIDPRFFGCDRSGLLGLLRDLRAVTDLCGICGRGVCG